MTCRALVSLALVALLATPAAAAKASFSPWVLADNGQNLRCVVQNLDARARSVTASIKDEFGEVAATGSRVDLPPGTVWSDVVVSGAAGGYCEFQGLSRKVRGYVLVNEGASTVLVAPAAP